MRIHFKIGIYLIAIIGMLSSCTSQQERDLDILPPAKGGKGELILVMDSTKWNGELGDAARKVFNARIYGLPQPEPMFNARFVTASLFRGLLKRHRNIVIITTFDSKNPETLQLQRSFTPESKKKIMDDPSLFMFTRKDEFAKGQQILHLFGQDEAQLIQKLKDNEKKIQNIFNDREEAYIRDRLMTAGLDRELEKIMKKNHGVSMKVPGGYKLAKDTTGFFWVRFPELKFDKNIFVAYKPYQSEKQFELDSIVNWRNNICKEHLYGDKDRNPDSFIITESLVPAVDEEVALNGKYAKEVRGLWKTKNLTMGGPFISYVFVDESSQQIFYVEGFIFAPSKQKREYVRELKVTLHSLNI